MKNLNFNEVAKEYKDMIYYHIHRLNLKRPHEDYFQEGLFALWKAHQSFEAKKGKFSQYANYMIKNRLLDMKRKERVHIYRDMYLRQTLVKQGASYMMKPVQDPYLWESVQSKMTVNQWKWIYQHIILDQPIKSIAKGENTSIDAVKSWGRQSIKKLRRDKDILL